MELSYSWIEGQFDAFNKAYFFSKLPRPRFRIGTARTRLGSLGYHFNARRQPVDFVITLSRFYDLSERDYQNVLLHEMIHLAISFSRVRDTSAHGRVFRKYMLYINSFGWNVTVQSKLQDVLPKSRRPMGNRLVVAFKMNTGQYFLSVVAPRFAREFDHTLTSDSRVTFICWYITHDEYFSAYRQVRSPRAVSVSRALFEEKTKSMTPLDFKR